MHKTSKLCLILLFISMKMQAQFVTPFERSNGDETATYKEMMSFYNRLEQEYKTIRIDETGPTDVSYPLNAVYYTKDGLFEIKQWKKKEKIIILINNGIHPGESDGIDASMMLLRDAAMGKIDVPENIVLAVIPVFNIGGMLNRGSYSRANQNGPKEYGFRGNAQNLDLNRDFIKLDAKETQSLVKLFHKLDPDIFIDNHVSNGADYQHVMTLLSVNPGKQGYHLGKYLQNKMEPALYESMKQKGYEMAPYVNHWEHTPDKGWQQFYEPPRFASGFAALFRTFAFVPETHMLKPYHQRVDATYHLMQTIIDYASSQHDEIKNVREMEWTVVHERNRMALEWKVDTTKFSTITFSGYEAAYKPSDVSGLPRLYYDKSKPFSKEVPFYDKFIQDIMVDVPKAYIVKQGWHKVIIRLKWNGVKMQQFKNDTTLELTVYRITNYETTNKPYEGHYLHSKVQYTKQKEKIKLLKGDYFIPVDQNVKRYLIETLEPNAPDAFFAWGFFDAILQQKEYFSDYVFEDDAAELLKKDPSLKQKLEDRKKSDSAFAKDGHAQLDFIYRNSPYYEKEHMRYPVFRID